MGKNLSYNNRNTRRVIFEKHHRYFYKISGTSTLVEECTIIAGEIMVGSAKCSECIYNKAHDDMENYVICDKIIKATSKQENG